MNTIFPPAFESNARANEGEVDPFTWVLLAEQALLDQRKEEALTLIEEAYRVYDERRADCPWDGRFPGILDDIAEAPPRISLSL